MENFCYYYFLDIHISVGGWFEKKQKTLYMKIVHEINFTGKPTKTWKFNFWNYFFLFGIKKRADCFCSVFHSDS